MALLNKVIFYILKCTVLNLNDISTKKFSEAMKFIIVKSLIIWPLVLLSIIEFFPVQWNICSYIYWHNLTLHISMIVQGPAVLFTQVGIIVSIGSC